MKFQLGPIPIIGFFTGFFLLVALAVPAMAQSDAVPAASGSSTASTQVDATSTAASDQRDQVLQLIGTLQNEAARTELIQQLELLIEADSGGQEEEGLEPIEALTVIDNVGSRAVDQLSDQVTKTRNRLGDILESLTQTPEFLTWGLDQVRQADVRASIVRAAIELFATLGTGMLFAAGFRRLTAGIWPHREGDVGRSLLVVMLRALGRIVLSTATLAIFAAVSYAVIILASEGLGSRGIAIGLVLTVTIRQIVVFLIGEIIRPRYVYLEKGVCQILALWLRRVATVAIYGYFLVTTIGRVGLPPELTDVVSNLLGLVVLVMVLRLIAATRTAIKTALLQATGPLAVLAHILGRFWSWLSPLYAIGLFITWSLGVDEFSNFAIANAATFATIVIALVIDTRLQRSETVPFADEVRRRPGESEPDKDDQAKLVADTAWHRARWPSRLLVAVAALLLVAQIWGTDVVGWLQGARGRELVGVVMNVILVCVVALVFWDIVRRGLDSWLDVPEGDAASSHRSQRARTLLPLIRTIIGFLLGSIVVLAVLSELGINIAPLLAGAGVIGLAIGFGSQALVRDVISGAFILAENTLTIGDVVKLGDHSGVVEGLTIRSVRLRDLSGTVHTIPLGEITAVENMTRDFSFYVMDIGISYSDDVDLVIQTLHELGEDLRGDETLGWDIMEPLEVLGVDQFADSAVIIKARIKTIPLRQWAVGREFNRRLKKRFDELGISIPFPQLTVSYQNQPDVPTRTPVEETPAAEAPESAVGEEADAVAAAEAAEDDDPTKDETIAPFGPTVRPAKA